MSAPLEPDIESDLAAILTEGERVIAFAPQAAFNSPLKRDRAVVTTRRFLIHRPRLLGRMDLDDFLWQDVSDVRISTQLLGATITVTAGRRGRDGQLEKRVASAAGLDKRAALRVYAEAQRIEEEWREKNRVRQMEEERARSGGVYLPGALRSASGTAGAAELASLEERLAKLRELHLKGLITDAEYESRKSQIISEL